VRDRWSHTGGPIYSTAINVLTLEFLYLPVRIPWWKQRAPRALVGEAAPVLDFPDGHLGSIVPEALSGRVVLLDFWSPWQLGYEEHIEARKTLVARLANEPSRSSAWERCSGGTGTSTSPPSMRTWATGARSCGPTSTTRSSPSTTCAAFRRWS
jgi:hypothetical protein